MKKAFMSVLILCLIAGTAACGSAGGRGGTAHEESSAAGGVLKEDWPVVRVEVCSFTETLSAEQTVEDALNSCLIAADAGVQADLVPLAVSDRSAQLTLMLTDPASSIDLFAWRWYASVTELVRNGQCICLEQYRESYPELWELFPEEVYQTCRVGGLQYSMPSGGCFCQKEVYALRKDIAEETGVSELAGTKISAEQLEEIMEKAEALYPSMCWQGDMKVFPFMNVDNLGFDEALGVLLNQGVGETVIVDYYASEEFRAYAEMCREWKEKGYFTQDPLNTGYGGYNLVNDGIGGGYIFEAFSMEYADALMSQQISPYEMVTFQLTEAVGTSACVYNGWNIAAMSENPDAAMKLLYLMYTDSTVARFFSLGVEGVTYEIREDGSAGYPEGLDSASVGWNCSAAWFYPNECLSIPFETGYVSMYEEMLELRYDTSVPYSSAMGFIFDDSAVSEEYAACAALVNEYREPLLLGQVEVDSYLGRFLTDLSESGIDAVTEEMQRQYSAFLKEKQ